ncbi:hypothetical protein [Notoacmeibacter marinus]|uniref:COG3904 family protein n=1 Tax=Notoacmeibacter marinus TaxID=1876515 RepID=UPI001964D49C|nr:hypothetical protein [Notoacmeibacter marinus]
MVSALLAMPLAFGLAACADDYDPVVFIADGDTLIVDGVVDERALHAFNEAIRQHPQTRSLTLAYVPGSADDDANLILARMVRSMGLDTIVPEGGLVSSGGTDLFLAGVNRRLAPSACIGVHSWDDDELGEGADLPRSDPIHRDYLRYYDDIGIDPEFYWFTLTAASADGMHWMTPDELARYDFGEVDGDGRSGRATNAYCDNL